MARSNTGSSANWLSSTTVPATAAPFTMACWFKPADAATYWNVMSLSQQASSGEYFVLAVDGTKVGDPVEAISASVAVGGEKLAATTSGITANTWCHCCAVFASASSRAAYINGASKGTETTSVTPLSINYLAVGSGRFSNAMFSAINGSIAEAAVWTAALDDAEVAAIGKGMSPLLVRPASLVRYWPIVGRYSPEIDLKNAAGLTINGTMTVADHSPIIMSGLRGFTRTTVAAAGGASAAVNLRSLMGVGT